MQFIAQSTQNTVFQDALDGQNDRNANLERWTDKIKALP